MKLWKKLSIIGLAVLMALTTSFALVGCCGNEKDWNVIELNEVTHSIFYAPLYVAINQGFFAEEGLTINLGVGSGSNTSMSTLISGSSDIILAGPETAVYTEIEGISDKPTIFGQLTARDGSFIMSKDDSDTAEDFSIEDLIGEKIIGGRRGGVPAMVLEWIIKEELKERANQVEIGYEDFGIMVQTWQNDNTAKYCTVFEPTATGLVNEHKGQRVASLGKLSGDIPYTCFIAKQSYLRDHGDIAQKFLKAVNKGYQFIIDNIEKNSQAVATALKPSFDGFTDNEIIIAAKAYKEIDAWKNDMILEKDDFNRLLDVIENAGELDARPEWKNVVDNSFATKLFG